KLADAPDRLSQSESAASHLRWGEDGLPPCRDAERAWVRCLRVSAGRARRLVPIQRQGLDGGPTPALGERDAGVSGKSHGLGGAGGASLDPGAENSVLPEPVLRVRRRDSAGKSERR